MYYQNLLRLAETIQTEMAICTVVSTKGSTPTKSGAKMIVTQNSEVYGTVGGGAFEKMVIEEALTVLENGTAQLFKHELLQQHEMCCGGTMEVFIERIEKKPKLYLFGAGHTGQALAGFASALEFDVTVIDDRKEYAEQCKNTGVGILLCSVEEALTSLPFDEKTYIVIMTYKHDLDRAALAGCLQKPHRYIGMIKSRRKILVTKKKFKDIGIAPLEKLDKVDMPIGIQIGAQGPAEIAISILARLIAVKNNVIL